MILNDLLSSDAYTPVNKKIAKELGFCTAGYLWELIRQRKRFGNEEFFFVQSDMEDEIGLTEHEQRESLKRLTTIEFVSVSKKGIPAKNYYKIDDVKVLAWLNSQSSKFLTTSGQDSWPLDVTNPDHYYNNNESKNENKITPTPRVKKKKEDKIVTIPSRSEIYSFMWDSKAVEKICDILEDTNIQESQTLEGIKNLYDWMLVFFKEKYAGKFYVDRDNNVVGADIVYNELDKFVAHYSEHQEKEILCLKARIKRWITNSTTFNQKK